MALYKYVKDVWHNDSPEFLAMHKKRLVEWRKQDSSVRIDRPTRLDRARSLGYKAKQGIIVVRQKVERGGRMRPSIRSGRRTAHNFQRKILGKSYQQVAEERANKSFPNCEVLNSYWVGEDAIYRWYEVILIDRAHPVMTSDKQYSGIAKKRGRVFRGLTSAGRKSRNV